MLLLCRKAQFCPLSCPSSCSCLEEGKLRQLTPARPVADQDWTQHSSARARAALPEPWRGQKMNQEHLQRK